MRIPFADAASSTVLDQRQLVRRPRPRRSPLGKIGRHVAAVQRCRLANGAHRSRSPSAAAGIASVDGFGQARKLRAHPEKLGPHRQDRRQPVWGLSASPTRPCTSSRASSVRCAARRKQLFELVDQDADMVRSRGEAGERGRRASAPKLRIRRISTIRSGSSGGRRARPAIPPAGRAVASRGCVARSARAGAAGMFLLEPREHTGPDQRALAAAGASVHHDQLLRIRRATTSSIIFSRPKKIAHSCFSNGRSPG